MPQTMFEQESYNRFDNLVSYLLQRYQQSRGTDRLRVIKAIAIYDDPRVIPFALEIVKNGHPDEPIATEALKLLAKRHYEAVVPIIADIIQKEFISSAWLLCLGRIGNAQAEAIITGYVRHRETLLRGSAMFALAMIARENDAALEKLSALVDDPIKTIRRDAVNALATVGKPAIYILVALIHSDTQTALQAIAILGEIKAGLAVPHLVPLLLQQDTSNQRLLAEAAARSLRIIGTKSAIDALNTWKKSQDSPR